VFPSKWTKGRWGKDLEKKNWGKEAQGVAVLLQRGSSGQSLGVSKEEKGETSKGKLQNLKKKISQIGGAGRSRGEN